MKKILIFTFVALTMLSCSDLNTPDGSSGKAFSIASGKKSFFAPANLAYQPDTKTWRFGADKSNNSWWKSTFEWGTGDDPSRKATDIFVDWGENAISNGGNNPNMWRTPTAKEWLYIFHERRNADQLCGFGYVNDEYGIILLPDNWKTPEGLTFNSCAAKGVVWDDHYDHYYNPQGDNSVHNYYSNEEWKKMEVAGAIFLSTGRSDYYWSSTPISSGRAYAVKIDNDGVYVNFNSITHFSDFYSYSYNVLLIAK